MVSIPRVLTVGGRPKVDCGDLNGIEGLKGSESVDLGMEFEAYCARPKVCKHYSRLERSLVTSPLLLASLDFILIHNAQYNIRDLSLSIQVSAF